MATNFDLARVFDLLKFWNINGIIACYWILSVKSVISILMVVVNSTEEIEQTIQHDILSPIHGIV